MSKVDIEGLKAERQTLLGWLKQLTDEQWTINNKIQATKDKIRKNSEAYIQQYIDKFKPGTTWCIDTKYCYEYFRVSKVNLDHYTYREEDIENCIIDIYGEYIQVPNPNRLEDIDKVNVQYKAKETICVKISEIDNIKEISFEDWSKVIQIIAKSATQN